MKNEMTKRKGRREQGGRVKREDSVFKKEIISKKKEYSIKKRIRDILESKKWERRVNKR